MSWIIGIGILWHLFLIIGSDNRILFAPIAVMIVFWYYTLVSKCLFSCNWPTTSCFLGVVATSAINFVICLLINEYEERRQFRY